MASLPWLRRLFVQQRRLLGRHQKTASGLSFAIDDDFNVMLSGIVAARRHFGE
ncbi:MAG: hypothetical protein ACOY5H_03845 [Pseudomonadota bacterium]